MNKSLKKTKKLIAFTKRHLKTPIWSYEDSDLFDLKASFTNPRGAGMLKNIKHASVYIKRYTDNIVFVIEINFIPFIVTIDFTERFRTLKAERKDIKKFKSYIKNLSTLERD